jgi:hypothetical protein
MIRYTRYECEQKLMISFVRLHDHFIETCMSIESRSSPKPSLLNLFRPFNYKAPLREFGELLIQLSEEGQSIHEYFESCVQHGLEPPLSAVLICHADLDEYIMRKSAVLMGLISKTEHKPLSYQEYKEMCQAADVARDKLVDSLNALTTAMLKYVG